MGVHLDQESCGHLGRIKDVYQLLCKHLIPRYDERLYDSVASKLKRRGVTVEDRLLMQRLGQDVPIMQDHAGNNIKCSTERPLVVYTPQHRHPAFFCIKEDSTFRYANPSIHANFRGLKSDENSSELVVNLESIVCDLMPLATAFSRESIQAEIDRLTQHTPLDERSAFIHSSTSLIQATGDNLTSHVVSIGYPEATDVCRFLWLTQNEKIIAKSIYSN